MESRPFTSRQPAKLVMQRRQKFFAGLRRSPDSIIERMRVTSLERFAFLPLPGGRVKPLVQAFGWSLLGQTSFPANWVARTTISPWQETGEVP